MTMRSLLLTYSLLLVCFCTLFSCHGDMEDEMLIGFDSLVEYHTDSAYQLLTDIQPRVDSLGSKATSMRYLMLLTSAKNKLDKLSPSDTTFMDAVDYYDLHGSLNDRMKARYLLGCIYKEMGESPLAITTFESAVDCADTLSPDCDWLTLLKIHGQAAATYRWQFNAVKELVEGERYSQCALKLGNDREYAVGLEIMAYAALTMNDSVKALDLASKSREVYLSIGLNQDGARTSLYPMTYYVDRGMWDKAETLIDSLESVVSDYGPLKDDDMESYHYVKGQYCLGRGLTADAEREFRSLPPSDDEYFRNKGLLHLYRMTGNSDSVFSYSMRYEKSLERILGRRQSTSLAAASANYKYDRIAGKEAEERHKSGVLKRVICIVLALCLSALVAWALWMRRRRKEVESLRQKVHDLSELIEQKAADAVSLRHNYDVIGTVAEEMLENVSRLGITDADGNPTEMGRLALELKANISYILDTKNTLLSVKTMELGRLMEQMNLLNSSLRRLVPHESKKDSSDDGLMELLQKKGSGQKNPGKATKQEIDLLMNCFKESWPLLNEYIDSYDITHQEKLVCVLTFLGFPGKDISVLLGTSKSRISTARNSANSKLFGADSAKHLKENLQDKARDA